MRSNNRSRKIEENSSRSQRPSESDETPEYFVSNRPGGWDLKDLLTLNIKFRIAA